MAKRGATKAKQTGKLKELATQPIAGHFVPGSVRVEGGLPGEAEKLRAEFEERIKKAQEAPVIVKCLPCEGRGFTEENAGLLQIQCQECSGSGKVAGNGE